MANGREIIPLVIWNGQILFSKRLFEPETKDFAGKPYDNPLYSSSVRFPKTAQFWYQEPALKGLVEACQTIMQRDMVGVQFQYVQFPIKDGDAPNKQGKVPEYNKGHWVLKASSSYPPKVEQLVNGVQSEIQALMIGGRKLWGDGDYVGFNIGVAKRATDNVGIKAYLNSVCFTGKGPELSIGGAAPVDWAAAAALAAQQGVEIKSGAPETGTPFGGAPGASGFPGADANPAGFGTAPGPQPGFNPNPQGAPGAGFNPGGFNPGQQGFAGGANPSSTSFNPGAGQGFAGANPQGAPGAGFNPGAQSAPFGDKPPF